VKVTADQYPYRASGTSLMAWIPKWAKEGGYEKLVQRLEDPETRKKIKEELSKVIEIRGGGENALISRFEPNPSFEGKNLAEVAEEMGLSVIDAAIKLVEMAAREKKGVGIVNFNQSEENIRKIMRKAWVMVGTDGYALKPEGVLSKGVAHPRSYGTFPRILGRYVREEGILSLEEAIRKMTSLPASKLGFKDRGIIREGMAADIVVFDPEKVIDRATYMNPHQFPEGIEYVIVNGELVVDKGRHTGKLPGEVLTLK
ncbi:MAG TPA: D-aminoacylase, partial [Candidatus Korarchaeota archaeon]|nr:D-aminoacylase [Candidatus Korarchaeota archaeon]